MSWELGRLSGDLTAGSRAHLFSPQVGIMAVTLMHEEALK